MKSSSYSSLLTDLSPLTMSYGYWKQGMYNYEAVFNLFFRENPFGGGYTVACGLKSVIDRLQSFRFRREDVIFLSELNGEDNQPLFEPGFLEYLLKMRFSCTVYGIPEGTVVFPHEPILRIQGPLIQCQLLESMLLNLINYQTLIATKASRIVMAAGGDPVWEIGLSRAQGPDGGFTASRAAYIGGCSATTNVLAAQKWGIPVKGSHAHSWVMSFENEMEAFIAYAQALPNNCMFMVDTYQAEQGVKNAIRVGKLLRDAGFEIEGLHLDSGDLLDTSKKARLLLDEAGFPDAHIMGSDDLDEQRIAILKEDGAAIDIWGVGTRLVTAYDQPALGGVYKLAALRPPGGKWLPKMKGPMDHIKGSLPGIIQVLRYHNGEHYKADVIINELWDDSLEELTTFGGEKVSLEGLNASKLLQIIFDEGKLVYLVRSIHQKRAHVQRELAALPAEIIRFQQPDTFPVGLEKKLVALREEMTQRFKMG